MSLLLTVPDEIAITVQEMSQRTEATLEDLLLRHADRVPFVFSGHTHRATEARLGATQGVNIGGDYHFKRLLILDWPAGTVTAHQFGDPNRWRV